MVARGRHGGVRTRTAFILVAADPSSWSYMTLGLLLEHSKHGAEAAVPYASAAELATTSSTLASG
jgi:hypothetical protein